MIHGFLDNNVITTEEQLFDMVLRGKQFNINHALELAKTPIFFDNREVDAFILDVADDKLVIQLALPMKEKFDDASNVYKTSYIRKLLISDAFLARFNTEFMKHVQLTKVNIENYTVEDKFWLLSHEEVDQKVNFLKPNNNTTAFSLFEHADMETYAKLLLKLNGQYCVGWRLRSAYSYVADYDFSNSVGYVSGGGYVYNDLVDYTNHGALCPVCILS